MPLLALRLENIGEFVPFRRVIAGVADQRFSRVDVTVAERAGELRIDVSRSFRGITALRSFLEALCFPRRRLAGPMGIGEIGAAVP